MWGTIAPFGDWALRINVFSAICSAAAVGLLFALCRQFGASRPAAALGALAVATSVSFWFNAAFAKHYAFSALLVVLAAVLVVAWERTGGHAELVAAGVVVALGTGASFQLMAIMALGLVALVIFGTRRITVRQVGMVVGAALLVTVVVWSYVVVHAGQDPDINWGRATTAPRLLDLVTQKDFLSGGRGPERSAGAAGGAGARGSRTRRSRRARSGLLRLRWRWQAPLSSCAASGGAMSRSSAPCS